jgi:hypothetical protein
MVFDKVLKEKQHVICDVDETVSKSKMPRPKDDASQLLGAPPEMPPGHILFQAAFANFNPHAATAVDFQNDRRAPLLLIARGGDHVSPASVVGAICDRNLEMDSAW